MDNFVVGFDCGFMGRERIDYLDLARGFCMCIMMLFHIRGLVGCDLFLDTVLFSSFMLPPFFFISGMLFKENQSFRVFIVNKINRLLIPFASFYLITAVIIPNVLHSCFGMYFGTVTGWKSLWAFVWPGEYPNQPLWFLWCLFLISLLFRVVNYCCTRWLHRHSNVMIAVVCVCFACLGEIGDRLFTVDVACVFNTLRNILFFGAGYIAKDMLLSGLDQMNNRQRGLWLVAALCVTLLYGVSFVHKCPLVESIAFFVCGIAGSVSVILASSMIGSMSVISYIGRYSIMVVLTHGLLIRACAPLSLRLNQLIGPYPTVLLIWALMILCYMAIIPLLRLLLPHITAQKPVLK